MPNKHTIERLVIYNRLLKELRRQDILHITSSKLGKILSRTSSQIRRDLSEVGKKGKPGVGYETEELIDALNKVLGLNKKWGVALAGAGNLGRALFYYPGFKREGFEFRTVIDSDPAKIGKKWSDIKIEAPSSLKKQVKAKDIEIGVVAVPESSAVDVAESFVKAGVKAILNFAPVSLDLPEDISLRYADLAMDMENLSFQLCRANKDDA